MCILQNLMKKEDPTELSLSSLEMKHTNRYSFKNR